MTTLDTWDFETCPYCESDVIDSVDTDHGPESIIQFWACIDCENRWEADYSFHGIHLLDKA